MTSISPLAHLEQIDRAELNVRLELWGHKMGPYRRPTFTIEHFVALFLRGEPVAVAVAADTPREVVGDTGLQRQDVVELARFRDIQSDHATSGIVVARTTVVSSVSKHASGAFGITDLSGNIGTVGREDLNATSATFSSGLSKKALQPLNFAMRGQFNETRPESSFCSNRPSHFTTREICRNRMINIELQQL